MRPAILKPFGSSKNSRKLCKENRWHLTPCQTDYLHFNGKTLRWHAPDGTVKAELDSVSGIPGYQSREHQATKDKGPLPEGIWDVQQAQYEEKEPIDALKSLFGRGTWPAAAVSWGSQRVWLSPAEGTDDYGRMGFSIHGGHFPGSAGCIDLTKNMPAFSKMFQRYGKDMKLHVDYGAQDR
jgi:hypothetical protein